MPKKDFNCNKCKLKDTERMVQCDSCDKWFHFECVGVNSDVANVSWSCSCGNDQPVVIKNSASAAATQTLPSINATAEFTAGLQAASSPATQPDVPGPSVKYTEQQPSQCSAYKKAQKPQKQDNTTALGEAFMAPVNLLPTTSGEAQYMQQNFVNFSGSNNSVGHLPSQTQLQLQMLEEEKELQRKYLEKKYSILAQGDVGQNFNSFINTSSFQPSASQIAARQVIPKELPNFDGNPEDWPLFISNYKNSTEIAGYTDGENLMRLQSCLKGRAKELVKSKLLIPSMVNEIIQTLEMCFGRPEHILDSMIEKATKTPPLKDKLDSLIEYALTIRNICSTMEACNLVAHLNNPLLVKTLVDKLPNNQKLNWAMHAKDDKVPVVKAFSDWLYTIAAAASQVVAPMSNKKSAAVNTHNQQITSGNKLYCVFCKSEEHKIQNCGEFQSLNLDAKWNVVKNKKLCRQCLNLHRRKCFSKKVCEINNCTAKHHPLLHKYTASSDSVPVTTEAPGGSVNAHNDRNQNKLCFRILPICIYGKSGSLKTFAFLDEGSSVTLMEQSLFEKLGLTGKDEPLELRWTGDTTRYEQNSIKMNMEVSNINNNIRFALYDVHTVSNLGLPSQSINFDDIAKKNKYLKGLPIQSYINAKPMVLIGLNNWRLAVPLKIKEGLRGQPIATKTRLGWALQGGATDTARCSSLNIHTCECEDRYRVLHDEVKEYFALDDPQEKNILSSENNRAIHILETTAIKINHQFEIGLLWKNDVPQLPDSYRVASHRLKCLQKKFHKDPQMKQIMQAEIDKLISKGYARKVLKAEMTLYNGRTWYLPIFVALNPNKPGKTRLVWDAAAKSNNKCLNDFLICGPDLLTSLFTILIEFRVGQIAICGDIAEMFHRINVKDEDMHAQRFLWFENGDVEIPCIYVMKALTFGISCAPCIAHFVRNKNADEFINLYPRAVKAIQSYHYMDDFIDSVDTEEEAKELAVQVRTIHASGGFHMRNWVTNSDSVRRHLCDDGSAMQTTFKAVEKILGMYWESSTDVFRYNSRFSRLRRDVFQAQVVPTKREVLQVLMSIFDPLGFVSHFTIGLKMLLQDIWRSGIKWDDELNEELQLKWSSWLANLAKISSICIPRCYSKLLISTKNVQIHTFVDAGENGYAAVSYFKIQHGDVVDISIVAAKSKVTPLKPISIPRLELQAALIGTRLAMKIRNGTRLNCTDVFFWSDSKTVLKWLRMDPKNFKPFVMYRVGEILEYTNINQWHWVPSKLNPADFATKIGNSDNDMWLNGPAFLKAHQTTWPKCPEFGDVNMDEIRNHLMVIDVNNFTMNVEYFSDWKRLYMALSQFILYIQKLKCKCDGNKKPQGMCFEIMQKSKNILFKYAQVSEFSEEIWSLKNQKKIHKGSKLKQLNIFLDDKEVLRTCGRAETLNCNNAIILPHSHYVTFLLVRKYHEDYHHCLHEATLSRIKSKFYIPKLRIVYKNVRIKCQRCRNVLAVPQPPLMASLPPARLASFERPFTYVGIDFFGPVYIVVGRHKEKRWGVLFTCLTVRAIHIEVAHSLDTSSCIMCIQNFISRRGSPKEIYTDNGTNFKSVERVLREEKQNINFHQVFCKHDDIKWKFNPPAAPHMGGAWERLVRTVKTILYAMCPAFKFNDESLRSALWEIEFIINSRPLTFVALDSAEDDALTPNHLLLGSADGYKPLSESEYDLRQRWHQTQKFANHFWRRWIREYGPNLVRRSKWFEKIKPPSVGDIVIIVDDNLPRNNWPKGIITETIAAKDGQVRRVKVKTSTSLFERPVTKIAVLDVGNRRDCKLKET